MFWKILICNILLPGDNIWKYVIFLWQGTKKGSNYNPEKIFKNIRGLSLLKYYYKRKVCKEGCKQNIEPSSTLNWSNIKKLVLPTHIN